MYRIKNVLNLANKNNIPVTIIKEGGIRGIVIKLELNDFKIKKNLNEVLITAESGMTLTTLANIALKEEISGLEFLFGIPGTIGGAIRMNAGAYGKEMKDIIVKTRYMTYDGKIKVLNLKEHEFEYRNSVFSKIEGIIIDTTIKAKKGVLSNIKNTMEQYSKSRQNTQPLDYPNAGSTFKRKEGIITAKLIDECGLKGFSVGDAEISTKHAGFIINRGKATSSDILNLVEQVKAKVKEKFDVDIELEILVLGEDEK